MNVCRISRQNPFKGGEEENVKPEKIQFFLRNGKTIISVGKFEIFLDPG